MRLRKQGLSRNHGWTPLASSESDDVNFEYEAKVSGDLREVTLSFQGYDNNHSSYVYELDLTFDELSTIVVGVLQDTKDVELLRAVLDSIPELMSAKSDPLT
jgi:hypothetical protein